MRQAERSFDETSWRYRGWRAVAGCFVMAMFGWGFAFYGHAVYVAELQRQHGWPAGLIGGASTVFYVCGAILVAFVGDAIARFGPTRVVLAGVVAMACSTLLVPHVGVPWQLYTAYLPMAIGWASLGLGAITNVVGLWFRERRGLALSLALNGATCGGIVVAPILVLFSERWGFATAMQIMTAVMAVCIVPAALWIGDPPGLFPSRPARSAGISAPAFSKSQALRNAHFWTVAGPFALALTAQVGFIVHLIAFFSPLLGRSGAGLALSVMTVAAVVGRVGLGAIVDRLDQRRASALSFLSQAIALATMMVSQHPVALFFACALFGFSVGNLITFPSLIIGREFEAASFGVLTALATAVAQFTYAFGPGLLGLVRDASGTYSAALAVCIGFEIAAAALVLLRTAKVASPAASD